MTTAINLTLKMAGILPFSYNTQIFFFFDIVFWIISLVKLQTQLKIYAHYLHFTLGTYEIGLHNLSFLDKFLHIFTKVDIIELLQNRLGKSKFLKVL